MKKNSWITCLDFLNKYKGAFTIILSVFGGGWCLFDYFSQRPMLTGSNLSEQIKINGDQNSVNFIKNINEAKLTRNIWDTLISLPAT